MANDKIRKDAKLQNVKIWEIAEAMGVHESTFHRMMRHELPEATQKEIISKINMIAEAKRGEI